jgi:hypothetical protein
MDPQALFGPLTTRSHRIGDFDTFILNNVPYAQVPRRNVQWGAVQYDGPRAPGIDGAKPVLQWHFGGVPYPISKAIRLYYTYIRTWDGSGDIITASIFLGFQDDLTELVVPQPIPYVEVPTQTFRTRVNNLGVFGQFSNQVWGSDHAVLGSEANGIVTRGFQPNGPAHHAFNELVQTELGWDAGYKTSWFEALTSGPVPVDFDGPAQDSDSHNIFAYSNATLFNDQDKYNQVLFWYFAGKPYRLTKAMRIPLGPVAQPAAVQPAEQSIASADAQPALQALAQVLQQAPGQPALEALAQALAQAAPEPDSFVLQAAQSDAATRTQDLQDQADAATKAHATAARARADSDRAAATVVVDPLAKVNAAELFKAAGAASDAAKAAAVQGHSLFIGFAGPGFGSGG